jgi:hypothetical protein
MAVKLFGSKRGSAADAAVRKEFMPWTTVSDYKHPTGWGGAPDAKQRAAAYCTDLERGGILYFASIPFEFPQADLDFLLSQKQSAFKGHKNISYLPTTDMLRGDDTESPEARARLQKIMREYSAKVVDFLNTFLSPYANKWKLDFASYRPIEEQNREASVHKRNDLMHVDAFPSRPTRGGRILRVFTNINPQRNRVWEVTEPFDAIAKKYAQAAGLNELTAQTPGRFIFKSLAPVFKAVGVKGTDRSAYDRFMLRFHDYLKENNDYQKNYPKERIEFPPNSSWLVYTDTVPHSVLSGQYALEQTFIVPMEAMVAPQHAPIRVLEGMVGRALSN